MKLMKGIKIILVGCGLFTLMVSNSAILKTTKIIEVNTMMIKNLKNYPYEGRFAITTAIDCLYTTAKDDAYQLSMPLIASAQQSNELAYKNTLPKIEEALKKIPEKGPKNSFKAWLLGRILLSADSIGDTTSRTTKIAELKTLLANPSTKKDCFSTWAWGYLAAINEDEYQYARKPMLKNALLLNVEYQEVKLSASTETQTKTQEALSNALWAWVMSLQAAANSKDKQTYDEILGHIKTITMQPTIAEALSKGLLRTATSNDYPAWAISIVQLAAARMGDEKQYNELSKTLETSIKEAKDSNATAEATLAYINQVLATANWQKQLELQNTAKNPALS